MTEVPEGYLSSHLSFSSFATAQRYTLSPPSPWQPPQTGFKCTFCQFLTGLCRKGNHFHKNCRSKCHHLAGFLLWLHQLICCSLSSKINLEDTTAQLLQIIGAPWCKNLIKVVKEDLCLEAEFRAKAEDLARSSRRHSLGGREPQGADVKPMKRTGERGGPGLQAERPESRVTWG